MLGIATNLTTALMVAGAGRLREEALGDEQKRALEEVFRKATSVMLVELARSGPVNRSMLERVESEFGTFFEDHWVAETLLSVALTRKEAPVSRLSRRFSELGFDPEALPVSFERAMSVFVFELTERLQEEASRAGSPLNNL